MKYIIILVLFFLFNLNLFGQDTSLVIGENKQSKFGLYDYSDIKKVNFEIIVWGGVANPGKYIIPEGTTLIDIISYAGIRTNEKLFGEIKLLRPKKGLNNITSSDTKKYNLENLFSKEVNNFTIENPELKPGDMLIFKFEPDKTFFDYVKDVLLFVTPIASLAALIITISRNN